MRCYCVSWRADETYTGDDEMGPFDSLDAARQRYEEVQEGRHLVEHVVYVDFAPKEFYQDWMEELICLGMNMFGAADKYLAALKLYNIELETLINKNRRK